jgi:ribulose-5-phosphate 4-epimerase/fuculose-1-phosphate aldolase
MSGPASLPLPLPPAGEGRGKGAALREEICRVGKSLFERRYAHATAGNISARLPDGSFLITPTDACLGHLDPQALSHVDEQGTTLSGAPPSKTLALHHRIYEAEPSAHCVIHTHSTHLVALTLAGVWSEDDIVPPLTPYQVMKVGHVPLVPYHRPGDPRSGDLVAQAIVAARERGTPLRAVMLDRLGPNVWHETPAAASAVLEELEETARLWLLTDRKPTPLDAAQIDALRKAFGASW